MLWMNRFLASVAFVTHDYVNFSEAEQGISKFLYYTHEFRVQTLFKMFRCNTDCTDIIDLSSMLIIVFLLIWVY